MPTQAELIQSPEVSPIESDNDDILNRELEHDPKSNPVQETFPLSPVYPHTQVSPPPPNSGPLSPPEGRTTFPEQGHVAELTPGEMDRRRDFADRRLRRTPSGKILN